MGEESSMVAIKQGRTADPLAGGGEMGALMRSIDWSQDGRRARFPPGPRACAQRSASCWRPASPCTSPGGRSSSSFTTTATGPSSAPPSIRLPWGSAPAVTFAEIWHIIGPMFQGVMVGTRHHGGRFPAAARPPRLRRGVLFHFLLQPHPRGGRRGGRRARHRHGDHRARARGPASQDFAGALGPHARRPPPPRRPATPRRA